MRQDFFGIAKSPASFYSMVFKAQDTVRNAQTVVGSGRAKWAKAILSEGRRGQGQRSRKGTEKPKRNQKKERGAGSEERPVVWEGDERRN